MRGLIADILLRLSSFFLCLSERCKNGALSLLTLHRRSSSPMVPLTALLVVLIVVAFLALELIAIRNSGRPNIF